MVMLILGVCDIDIFVFIFSTFSYSMCWSVHTRDVRYTGTVKLPVFIIFQMVRYLIILHNSVFHTLLFRSSPVGGSASHIAAHPVNVISEQVNSTMDQTD